MGAAIGLSGLVILIAVPMRLNVPLAWPKHMQASVSKSAWRRIALFALVPLFHKIEIRPVERTPVGTLHVDIFDSQSKKVIWHGVCTDSLTGNPEKNEKKLEKSVADVFKKFPPPEKG